MERLWEENAKIKFLQKNPHFLRSSTRQKVEKDIDTVFLENGFKKPPMKQKRVDLEMHFIQRNFKLRTDPQTAQKGEKKNWNEEWESF